MEKKYVVPPEMIEAAKHAYESTYGTVGLYDAGFRISLEAAIRRQAEHPPVPSEQQRAAMTNEWDGQDSALFFPVQWMRIAYLTPEPEIPREVMGLFAGRPTIDKATHDRTVVEAYELGLRAGRQG